MAHDVFISHAGEDKQVAARVCGALEAEGVRCWIAPRDIPPGMEYEESIVEAIAHSPVLVLILSSHSNASAHVRREVSRAFVEGSSTRVIPFRVEDVQYGKALSYYLGSAQWIDASTPPIENHLLRLVEHVRAPQPPAIGATQTREAPPADKGRGRRRLVMWLMLSAGALLSVVLIAVNAYRSPGADDGNENSPANGNISVSAIPTPVLSIPASNFNVPVTQTTPGHLRTPSPTPAAAPTPRAAPPRATPPPPSPSPSPSVTPKAAALPVRKDADIEAEVDEIFSELEGGWVKASVKNGVVTLTGEVNTQYSGDVGAAEEKAKRVKGVKRIVEKIKWVDSG